MSGEKTEKPTPKKIKDSRKKGQVSYAKELVTLGKLLFLLGGIIVFPALFTGPVSDIFDQIFFVLQSDEELLVAELLVAIIWPSALLFMGFAAAGMLIGMFSTWAHIGFVVSTEPVLPSIKKLNFVENIKNMFSKKSLLLLVTAFFKITFVFLGLYYILTYEIQTILLSVFGGLTGVFESLHQLLKKFFFTLIAILGFFSILDWLITYMAYLKSLRMSKNDLKDEYKVVEGNPEIKHHRKQEHRSILNSSLSKLGDAKVLVTNPTHIAVGLDYEPGVHDVPYVLFIEVDEQVPMMRKRAEELQIPVVEYVALARAIYRDCQPEEYIKSDHLEMAAAVFREIMNAMDGNDDQT